MSHVWSVVLRIILEHTYKDKGDSKIIKHFVDQSLGTRCYVKVLKLYLSKLSPKVKLTHDANFYGKPKANVTENDSCWYIAQTCEKNFHANVVKSVC